MVDKNSVVDRNSAKLVDESSVVVQNTGLKLEGLDEKAAVDQRVFSHLIMGYFFHFWIFLVENIFKIELKIQD